MEKGAGAIPFSFTKTTLPGVIEIVPDRYGDARGYFAETYNRDAFAEPGIARDWVQDNHSLSRQKGVLRGLHYQREPFAQDKLIRVVRGSVLDVAIDIRVGSPTFARWVSCVLSAETGNQLFVPKGFAHGFLTLEPDTEVLYKVSAPYSPAHDAAIRFDDPAIGIDWQFAGCEPILSQKDSDAPRLIDQETGFAYDPVDEPA